VYEALEVNTWQRYAAKEGWKTQTLHFLMINGLIIFLNIGLQQRNPLACWTDTHFLEQVIFASMMILPFSVISSIIHLHYKWKSAGELKLLNYLNVSPLPYLKPVLIIMTWVLLLWIIQREVLWPRLVKPKSQENHAPIKFEHDSVTLIYQPRASLTRGSLLVIHHGKTHHYPLVTMLETQWQLSKPPNMEASFHHQILKNVNLWIPNTTQLRIILGQQHQLSIFELISSSDPIPLKAWTTRFVVPLFVWMMFLVMWVATLHRPHQIEKRLTFGSLTLMVIILLSYQ
jgi:hypothetical protein